MPSLTPAHRAEETAEHAFRDGVISGVLALIPSSAAVYLAMQNKTFIRSTNWQSRTALIIMPPLFMFGFSSESKLQHRMQQMASEADHSRSTAEWAEEHEKKAMAEERERLASSLKRMDTSRATSASSSAALDQMTTEEVERQLTELYNQSVKNSGVRIVPGNLGIHHEIANYWQQNPFKMLAALGIPTVLYIFKGKNSQQHLQLQSKIMHTRVYGQFAVIGMLLSLMGFKSYMDSSGTYITEAEANARVEDMKRMRLQLKERIRQDKVRMEQRARVLEGMRNNSEEHKERASKLVNVDDFEAQMEQAETKESSSMSNKKKKDGKKKKKKAKKDAEAQVVTIEEDELEKDLPNMSNQNDAIKLEEADRITDAQ